MTKKNIAILGGGNSGEREISLKSLKNVRNVLINNHDYHVFPIVVTKNKFSYEQDGKEYFIDLNDFSLTINHQKITFDCVYNTIHGTPGENGLLQGYLEIMGIPYTSSNVLVSSITFNKDVCKKFLADMPGMLHSKAITVSKNDAVDASKIIDLVGLPCFVKPNNGGSSVATAKINEKEKLAEAIKTALTEDEEVIIEEFIQGTEITCGVAIIDGKIKALGITEVVSATEFFDYHAKYVDKKTQEITPARISKELYARCEQVSEKIYKDFACKGIVRIDYIIKNDQLYFLEVNTTPGMTDRSIVPQQAEQAGIPVVKILSECIERAIQSSKI